MVWRDVLRAALFGSNATNAASLRRKLHDGRKLRRRFAGRDVRDRNISDVSRERAFASRTPLTTGAFFLPPFFLGGCLVALPCSRLVRHLKIRTPNHSDRRGGRLVVERHPQQVPPIHRQGPHVPEVDHLSLCPQSVVSLQRKHTWGAEVSKRIP